MMMTFWLAAFHVALIAWLPVITIAAIDTAGSSFSGSFSRVIGRVLRGSIIYEFEVAHQVNCRKKCGTIGNCQSVNLISIDQGKFLCQLNSANKDNSLKAQYVASSGGEYFEMKKKRVCTQPGGSCNTGGLAVGDFVAFNQTLFKYVPESMTWHDARAFCLLENGDLASIHSAEELDFILEIIIEFYSSNTALVRPNAYFVGLTIGESGYVWSDGSSFVYTGQFVISSPEVADNQDCIVLQEDKLYHNRGCNDLHTFICNF